MIGLPDVPGARKTCITLYGQKSYIGRLTRLFESHLGDEASLLAICAILFLIRGAHMNEIYIYGTHYSILQPICMQYVCKIVKGKEDPSMFLVDSFNLTPLRDESPPAPPRIYISARLGCVVLTNYSVKKQGNRRPHCLSSFDLVSMIWIVYCECGVV